MSETNNMTKSPDFADIFKKFDEEATAFSAKLRVQYAALEKLKKLTAQKAEEYIVVTQVEVPKEFPAEEQESEALFEENISVESNDTKTTDDFNDIIVKPAPELLTVATGAIPIQREGVNINKVPVRKPTETAAPAATTVTETKKKSLPTFEKGKAIKDDKKKLNKKAKIQKGYETNSTSVEYDETGEVRKIRTRKSPSDKKKFVAPPQTVIEHAVITTDNITIKMFSEKVGKPVTLIIKKLFDLGILKTINDTIDFDVAELIAADFGITLEQQVTQTSEEKLFAFHEEDEGESTEGYVARPPIVTIMGHVDHGKTSVLDYIRKANVAAGEAGGITQHIGAYMVSLNGQPITFLDTPGHAAFTAMRARGANVTDIAVIVVAADDGIMPQTIEAINHAKAAKVEIIIAINKMDKATANPDRILQQLTEHNLLVEDWGGTIPAIRVSAHTGQGIQQLLETILVTAEVMDLKANPNRSAKGTVIEAKLDKGKGPVTTILVQNGTLNVSDFIVAGTSYGRIRAMFDDKGRQVKSAAPSVPVSVLGLQEVPNAGDQVLVVADEKLSKMVVEERKNKEKIEKTRKQPSLEDFFKRIKDEASKDLNLVIKADVQGSVEALKTSLEQLSNNEVKVNVIHGAVGAINESDVTLAMTANAVVIGFNVRPDTNAKTLAERQDIEIKLYKIIYEAIDEISLAINGLLAPTFKEVYLGRAEVRQVYKASSIGAIAGSYVKDGKIMRNAKIRIIRDGKVILDNANLASLKRFKDDVKEVATGFECGIVVNNYNDVKEGDIIEAFVMEEVKK